MGGMNTNYRTTRQIQTHLAVNTWLLAGCLLLLLCCFGFLFAWEYRYQQAMRNLDRSAQGLQQLEVDLRAAAQQLRQTTAPAGTPRRSRRVSE